MNSTWWISGLGKETGEVLSCYHRFSLIFSPLFLVSYIPRKRKGSSVGRETRRQKNRSEKLKRWISGRNEEEQLVRVLDSRVYLAYSFLLFNQNSCGITSVTYVVAIRENMLNAWLPKRERGITHSLGNLFENELRMEWTDVAMRWKEGGKEARELGDLSHPIM